MYIFVPISIMEDSKDKIPYIPPRAIVAAIRDHGVLCSSFGSSSNESMGFGESYDENTFN